VSNAGSPAIHPEIAGVVASYFSPTINTEDALTLEAAGLAPTEFVPHTTLRPAGEFSDQVAGPPAMGAVREAVEVQHLPRFQRCPKRPRCPQTPELPKQPNAPHGRAAQTAELRQMGWGLPRPKSYWLAGQDRERRDRARPGQWGFGTHQRSHDVQVAGADRELVVLAPVNRAGNRVGGNTEHREILGRALHQAGLHLIGCKVRFLVEQQGHRAADHGRRHAGAA